MLYVSFTWRCEHLTHWATNDPSVHLRPGGGQLDELYERGYVMRQSTHNLDVIPRLDKDPVRAYYAKYGVQLSKRLRHREKVVWIINILDDKEYPAAIEVPYTTSTEMSYEQIWNCLSDSAIKYIRAETDFLHQLSPEGATRTLRVMEAQHLMSIPALRKVVYKKIGIKSEPSSPSPIRTHLRSATIPSDHTQHSRARPHPPLDHTGPEPLLMNYDEMKATASVSRAHASSASPFARSYTPAAGLPSPFAGQEPLPGDIYAASPRPVPE